MAVFISFGGFTALFPGDLEDGGWKALLALPAFVAMLQQTTLLVASHHGRESGYCSEVFLHCHPQVVVMSDKGIEHDTQRTGAVYRRAVTDHHPDGVFVATTRRRRHVLTTRNDGHIHFTVTSNGSFSIETEYNG